MVKWSKMDTTQKDPAGRRFPSREIVRMIPGEMTKRRIEKSTGTPLAMIDYFSQ
jgi:hypothetical protein